MSLFSYSPEELVAFADGHGVDAANPPVESWFLAEEGLETIRFMKEEHLKNRQASDEALKDLQEFQSVLELAKKHEVRWHLAIDF